MRSQVAGRRHFSTLEPHGQVSCSSRKKRHTATAIGGGELLEQRSDGGCSVCLFFLTIIERYDYSQKKKRGRKKKARLMLY
jgi:hypothetical protein